MLEHDLKTALRRFSKQRFHSVVCVAVLALGLVCFIAATIFLAYVHGYDRHWPSSERIYLVLERVRPEGFGLAPAFDTGSDPPIAELLRVEVPELAAVARVHVTQQVISVADRRVPSAVAFADAQFTEIFELTALVGDARRSLATPRSAVITQRAAERLFGSADAAGRSLTLITPRPVDITVNAVVLDLPDQSHLRQGGLFSNGADVFLSWDVLETFRPPTAMNWGSRSVKTYALLPADGTLPQGELDRRLDMIAAERVPPEWQFLNLDLESLPISAIAALGAQNWFQGHWGGSVWVDVLAVLRAAAAAVLAIACLNFLNLAVAEGVSRSPEISMRKVLGAKSRHLVRQDLLHTAMTVCIALGVALATVVPLAKLFAAPWSLSLRVPWTEAWLILFLGGTLFGVTVTAGVYPALMAARARRAAAASRFLGARDVSARIRMVLIGAQFAAAGALVVGAIVLFMQRNELHEALVGRFTDQYVGLFVPQSAPATRDLLANELHRGPGILGTTAMSPPAFMSAPRRLSRSRDGTTPRMVAFTYTSDDYFDVMEIPLVVGRVFQRARGDDALPSSGEEWASRRGRPPAIVLDEVAARDFGWPDPAAALGEVLYGPGGGPHEIIGIVEPVPTSIRDGGASGAAYVFSPASTNLHIVRIAAGDIGDALEHIDETVKAVLPGQPSSRLFFDEIFAGYYRTFEITNRVLTGLAAFALLISATGLYGMATYLAQRRTREVAIRKVQGATSGSILRLMLWEFSKPVMWANLAVWPLVLIALHRYLGLFAERVAITPLPFLIALAVTWLFVCLAVSGCAWRAAKLHPADALRQ